MSEQQSPTEIEDDRPQGPVPCARHPSVETVLRCSRCETPICPKCVIPTPVGGRCRTCAQVRRIPFVVKPKELAQAIGLGLAVALIGGVLIGTLPFFRIFALIGLGYVVGETVSYSAKRKRGLELGIVAVVVLVLGYALSPLLASFMTGRVFPFEWLPLLFTRLFLDLFGLLGLGVAALLAWMRVR